jgi:phosphatidylinositol glycan class T
LREHSVYRVKVHYVPGKDRSRAYHLEVVFRLRANSVTKLTLSFERTFLKWTEYPPDANHGFYINSAVVSTVLPLLVEETGGPGETHRPVTSH